MNRITWLVAGLAVGLGLIAGSIVLWQWITEPYYVHLRQQWAALTFWTRCSGVILSLLFASLLLGEIFGGKNGK